MARAGAELDRNGLEVLDRDECVRLLRTAPIGRLGVSSDALPAVFPVNHVVDGEQIVVRTNAGTKLDAAVRGAVVAFEVDYYDAFSHLGWSVLVTGRAREVTDPAEVARLRSLPLRAWGARPAERFVTISMDIVSGRRTP